MSRPTPSPSVATLARSSATTVTRTAVAVRTARLRRRLLPPVSDDAMSSLSASSWSPWGAGSSMAHDSAIATSESPSPYDTANWAPSTTASASSWAAGGSGYGGYGGGAMDSCVQQCMACASPSLSPLVALRSHVLTAHEHCPQPTRSRGLPRRRRAVAPRRAQPRLPPLRAARRSPALEATQARSPLTARTSLRDPARSSSRPRWATSCVEISLGSELDEPH